MELTLGELVDRLSITNLKMWHIEEKLQDSSIDMAEKGRLCEDIVKLNTLRNKLIEAIDEKFAQLKEIK